MRFWRLTFGEDRISVVPCDWSRVVRLIAPLFPFYGTRYDVAFDEMLTGWWMRSFSLSVESCTFGGLMLRLNWFDLPFDSTRKRASYTYTKA